MRFHRLTLPLGLVLILTSMEALSQLPAPLGATLQLPGDVGSGWALPATVEMLVTHPGASTFTGSNNKLERGSPFYSGQVDRGATFYRCDTVGGFPQRLGSSSPFINRRGGSSFIAVAPATTPDGTPTNKVWICASVGAFRTTGTVTAEWEYQIRYFSGDPATGSPATLVIGTVPNANFFSGESRSEFEVSVDFAGTPDLVLGIGDGLHFPTGYRPDALGSISVTVTNLGNGPAVGSLTLNYYLSNDEVLDIGADTPIATHSVPNVNIPPEGVLPVVSDLIRLPPSMPSLPYFFLVEVRAGSEVGEMNVANNTAAAPPELPSLALELKGIRIPDPRPGRSGPIDLVIRNIGKGPFPGGEVDLEILFALKRSEYVLLVPEIPVSGQWETTLPEFLLPQDLFTDVQPPEGRLYVLRFDLDPSGKLFDPISVIDNTAVGSLTIRGFDIRGSVVTVTRHRPVAGVQVHAHRQEGFVPGGSNSALSTATTGEDGAYLLAGLPYGDFIVEPQQENWVFSALDDWREHRIVLLDAFPGETLVLRGEVEAFPYYGFSPIQVLSVATEYKGTPHFVSDIGFDVEFTAKIDWGSHEPGQLLFEQDGDLRTEVDASGTEEQMTFTLDVGGRFLACKEVEVIAVSDAGVESEAYKPPMVMISEPWWPPIRFSPVNSSNPLYFKLSSEFDMDIIESIGIDPQELTDIPLIGDGGLGLAWKVIPTMELQDNIVTATISGFAEAFEFRVGKLGTLEFEPYFELEYMHHATPCEWRFKTFSAGVSTDVPVLSIFYPLPSPWPIFVRGSVDGGGTLAGSVNRWTVEGPLFEFSAAPTLTGRVSVEGGIPFVLSVGGFGQLEGGVQFQIPPGNFTSGQVSFEAGATFTFIGRRNDAGLWKWEWNWPDNGAPGLHRLDSGPALRFRLMDRGYVDRDGYGTFHDGRRGAIQPAGMMQGDPEQVEWVLQEGIYPESNAELCVHGDAVVLAWVFDDPEREIVHRTVAVTSRRVNGVWSAPEAIWDDGTGDFNPRLKTAADGSIFATWEDLAFAAEPDAGLEEIASALEVSVARWDVGMGRWVDAQRLSDNDTLDRTPRLITLEDGSAEVFWIANPGNHIVGGPDAPNLLMTAVLDEDGWTDPAVVIEVPHPIFYYDVTRTETGREVVFSLDTDGDLSTVEDHDLYRVRQAQGAWGVVERLTTDNVADTSPQFADLGDGVTRLLWLRNGELSLAPMGDLSARSIARTSGSLSFLTQIRLASDGRGRLAVTWVEPSEHLADIGGVFYDGATGLWSDPIALSNDAWVERGVAGVLKEDGSWLGAFNRFPPPEPGADPGTEWPVEADLVVRQAAFGGDFGLEADGVILDPPNPHPGEGVTVRFAVRNRSAWPMRQVPVALSLGVSGQPGVEVARSTLDLVAGGGVAEGTILWVLPTVLGTNALLTVQVDPSGSFEDRSRSDNTLALGLARPDLEVRPLYWIRTEGQGIEVTAEVANAGASRSASAALEMRAGSSSPEVKQRWIVPELDPGEMRTFHWSLELPADGEVLEVTAGLIEIVHADSDPANDMATLLISVGGGLPIRMEGVELVEAGGVKIRFQARPGVVHLLESSDNLSDWLEVKRFEPAGERGEIVDERPAGASSRFYRLRRID